jgi:hypothetical protein
MGLETKKYFIKQAHFLGINNYISLFNGSWLVCKSKLDANILSILIMMKVSKI